MLNFQLCLQKNNNNRNAKLLSNSKQTISGENKRAPSGGNDQAGDPLENRLQITDLDVLKQAFDVCLSFLNVKLYVRPR